jgi:hypothetical protein
MNAPTDVPPLTYASPLDDGLDPGERLLWTGQPRPGIYLEAGDVMMIPFSLMWGGFAFFWETMAVRGLLHHPRGPFGPGYWIMPLWGVPFVLVGIYMIFGRFLVDAWRRRWVWYGVTDRRALIVERSPIGSTVSVDLRTVGTVTLTTHFDGCGTITFGSTVTGRYRRGRNTPAVPAFRHISEAQTVYRIVREVQAGLPGEPVQNLTTPP